MFVEALDGFAETSDGREVDVVKLGNVAREDDVDVREAFTRGTSPADAGDLCPISVEGVGTGARDAVAKDVALEEVTEVLTLVLGAVVGFLSESGNAREVAADAMDLGRDRRDGPEVIGGGDGVGSDATDAVGAIDAAVGAEPVELILGLEFFRPALLAKGTRRVGRVLRA